MIDIGLLIDLYVFKKKQNKKKIRKSVIKKRNQNKQKQKQKQKKHHGKCQNQWWLKREINPLTKQRNNWQKWVIKNMKNKTRPNGNNKKGNDDLKERKKQVN